MDEAKMTCPHCQQDMRPVVEPDLTFHKCPGCRGIFLDRGEFNALATGMAGDIEFCLLSHDAPKDDDARRVCPRCGPLMEQKTLFDETALVLDFCRDCGGWFLDSDELERVNERLAELRVAQGTRGEHRARHRGHLATLTEYTTTEAGEFVPVEAHWTRAEAYYLRPLDAALRVRPKTWTTGLARLLGNRGLETGAADFDRIFAADAKSPAALQEKLTPSVRKAVLEFYRSPRMELGKRRTFEVLDDRTVFCYSAWGDERAEPSEPQREALLDALVDLAIAIESPGESAS